MFDGHRTCSMAIERVRWPYTQTCVMPKHVLFFINSGPCSYSNHVVSLALCSPRIRAKTSLHSSIRSTRRNEVLSPWEYLLARCGFVELIRVVVFLHFHGFPAERFSQTEPHLENVTFNVEKASFEVCFGHLNGGIHDPCFMDPVYV